MLGKLFQWTGVLAVFALCAAAAGALWIAKDRVRLVVQADAAAPGPDPVALLRDDVAALQREFAELRSSMGPAFERLGTAIDERAEARHAEVKALAASVAELARAVDALTVRAAAPLPVAEPALSAAPAPEPAAEPPAAAKAAFLSFALPDATLRFDEPATYALIPELCRVGFDAKSTLHDFTGVTSKVAGQFIADFDDPSGAWRGEVACEAGALATGLDGRDENLREHLDAAHHPQIVFTIAGFAPEAVDAVRQTAAGAVSGRMTIRGRSRDVSMPIRISVDASKRIVIEGQMPLKLSDYDVPVPSQLGGAITMQDEVSVWIALRARVRSGGSR